MSGCSVFETEDIYFDEELHPSLENDPNMQVQYYQQFLIIDNFKGELNVNKGEN